jgi:uncharacterized protein (TIGR02001 family)
MRHSSIPFSSFTILLGMLTLGQASDWSTSGNLALTSDYVFRGITQTDTGPALQVGVDVNHSKGFLAGAWVSNVDKDSYANASMEVDLYIGWNTTLGAGGTDFTFKALRMNYPGTDFSDNNTNEFSAYFGRQVGLASLSVGATYSNDSFGLGKYRYLDGSVSMPLGPTTIGLHVGMNDFDNIVDLDYMDYSLSVSGDVAGLGLSLTFSGTDAEDAGYNPDFCDDRIFLTISKVFTK